MNADTIKVDTLLKDNKHLMAHYDITFDFDIFFHTEKQEFYVNNAVDELYDEIRKVFQKWRSKYNQIHVKNEMWD